MLARLEGFENLISIDEAISTFMGKLNSKRLESQKISVDSAFGRVTAENIEAKVNLPPFDRSTVDGYAVRAKDTFEASLHSPKTLNLTKDESVSVGEAKEIWTGNPLHEGADAVVMLEHTKRIKDEIQVLISLTPDGNVSKKGEDVQRGEIAVKEGTRLNPYHIGLLAAMNITKVNVVKKPRIALLSVGNELAPLGGQTKQHPIVDSNKIVISCMCEELGAKPMDLGIAKDDVKEISDRILEGLDRADLVITSGGTSVGYPDFVTIAINKTGAPGVIVHGIAMRPGMPTALGILQGKPILSLSGNPVAAVIGFEVFARPLLLRLLGIRGKLRPLVKARITRNVMSALGMRVFLRVKVFKEDSEFYADPIRIKGSGIHSTMTKANGYVVIDENCEGLHQDELVIVHLFDRIAGL